MCMCLLLYKCVTTFDQKNVGIKLGVTPYMIPLFSLLENKMQVLLLSLPDHN